MHCELIINIIHVILVLQCLLKISCRARCYTGNPPFHGNCILLSSALYLILAILCFITLSLFSLSKRPHHAKPSQYRGSKTAAFPIYSDLEDFYRTNTFLQQETSVFWHQWNPRPILQFEGVEQWFNPTRPQEAVAVTQLVRVFDSYARRVFESSP